MKERKRFARLFQRVAGAITAVCLFVASIPYANAADVAADSFVHPVTPYENYRDDSPFLAMFYSERRGKFLHHLGRDFNLKITDDGDRDADSGKPVVAIGNGTVVYVRGTDKLRSIIGADTIGKVVVIRHTVRSGKEFFSVAMHVKDILVTAGQPVVKGQPVATIGNSDGYYTAAHNSSAHLHFEIRTTWTPPVGTTGDEIYQSLVKNHDPYLETRGDPRLLHYCNPDYFVRSNGECVQSFRFADIISVEIGVNLRQTPAGRLLMKTPGETQGYIISNEARTQDGHIWRQVALLGDVMGAGWVAEQFISLIKRTTESTSSIEPLQDGKGFLYASVPLPIDDLCAECGGGQNLATEEATVSPDPLPPPPSFSSDVKPPATFSAVLSDTDWVHLTFGVDPSYGENVVIERSIPGGTWQKVGTTTTATTSMDDRDFHFLTFMLAYGHA